MPGRKDHFFQRIVRAVYLEYAQLAAQVQVGQQVFMTAELLQVREISYFTDVLDFK